MNQNIFFLNFRVEFHCYAFAFIDYVFVTNTIAYLPLDTYSSIIIQFMTFIYYFLKMCTTCITLLLLSAVYVLLYFLQYYNIYTQCSKHSHITQNYSIIIVRIYIKLRNCSGIALRGDWWGEMTITTLVKPSSRYHIIFVYIMLSSIIFKHFKGLWGRIGRRPFMWVTSFCSNFVICRKLYIVLRWCEMSAPSFMYIVL